MTPQDTRKAKSPPRLSCAISVDLFNRKNHPTLGLPYRYEHQIMTALLTQYLDIVEALEANKRPRFHAAFIGEHINIISFPNTRRTIEKSEVGYGWLERLLEGK